MYSNVRIFPPAGGKPQLKAFASVQVGGEKGVFITGIRIVQGSTSLFIGMPSRKMVIGGNSERPIWDYRDIVIPASRAGRMELENLVLAEYKKALESGALPKE